MPSLVGCGMRRSSCSYQCAAACPLASTALCAAGAGAWQKLLLVMRQAHAVVLWHPWHPLPHACASTALHWPAAPSTSS